MGQDGSITIECSQCHTIYECGVSPHIDPTTIFGKIPQGKDEWWCNWCINGRRNRMNEKHEECTQCHKIVFLDPEISGYVDGRCPGCIAKK